MDYNLYAPFFVIIVILIVVIEHSFLCSNGERRFIMAWIWSDKAHQSRIFFSIFILMERCLLLDEWIMSTFISNMACNEKSIYTYLYYKIIYIFILSSLLKPHRFSANDDYWLNCLLFIKRLQMATILSHCEWKRRFIQQALPLLSSSLFDSI